MAEHLIGMLLGTENDWPTAFAALLNGAKLDFQEGGERHTFRTEPVTIEPFSLRAKGRYRVVIDRLAYWYFHPREWLKKSAMMDETYLLNNPFTFQSMEKHTAFCGMMRLGLNIPETWLLPPKVGPENERYRVTAERYNRMFDLEALAGILGYPLYMKPFEGGGWVGVNRVENAEALHRAYDESGRQMMHLQAAICDYQTFCRSLSIGPQTCVMRYRPEEPMHARYAVEHDFLDADTGWEVQTIGRLVNAFFRWEFNSCETIIKDGVVYPIDFANAVPDVALTSLHYYFPWAMTALVRWSVFVAATHRLMKIDMNKRRYFAVADRTDLSYHDKLREYEKIVDAHFERERFLEFCERHLGGLDEVAVGYFGSPEFDELLVRTVRETFPEHERETFTEHFRGLIAQWVADQG